MLLDELGADCGAAGVLGTRIAVQRRMLAARYRSARDAHIVQGFWARSGGRVLLLAPALLVIEATLALGGVAPWRIAAIGAVGGAVLLLQAGLARTAPTRPFLGALFMVMVVPGAVAAGLTGGLTSPLALVLVGTPLAATVALGRGRESAVVLAAAALAALLLALEPASWAGPALPRPVAAAATVESLIMIVVLARREVLAAADANLRAHDEVERLREEGLIRLCESHRSLQNIGARVAHELKNPLAAIKGLVQLVARDGRDGERVDVITQEVARMEDILRDYLSYARPLEDLRPEPVALGVLAREVAAALAGRAEIAGVTLAVAGDATVAADRRRLKEALINLVQNAIEACAPGAAVALEVGRRDGRAEIRIRDGGRGIPPEALARIGTPFFTTRANGTGLGVVLARSVVVQHGGGLEYESAPGRGTRVTVHLPIEGSHGSLPARG